MSFFFALLDQILFASALLSYIYIMTRLPNLYLASYSGQAVQNFKICLICNASGHGLNSSKFGNKFGKVKSC